MSTSASVRRLTAGRSGIALAIAGVLLLSLPPPAAESATDRLPDLRAARIRDVRIVRTSSGRRLLRFTSIMWNRGAGPFEVRASRSSTSKPWRVQQIVYNDAGSFRRVTTDARLRYAGDGHNHWHVRDMMTYHLWGSRGTLRDKKIGFCFFDTNLVDGSLPRSPSRPVYVESKCGRRTALNTRTGISVGWGDRYPWNFAYQWVDITGLPGGTYTLRTAVDLYRHFSEQSDANNCAWLKIRFGSTGTGVSILDRGTGCINDHKGTIFEDAVAWAKSSGVSGGCDADMYCTRNPLSRGALATMLARALGLPSTSTDFFDDDDGSSHEANINRLAAAGIAKGCGTRRFCPTSIATRGSGASILARALELPTAKRDYYTDDERSSHEAAINKLAEAGIASSCGVGRFCPTADLSRGVWTLFLYRALGTSH